MENTTCILQKELIDFALNNKHIFLEPENPNSFREFFHDSKTEYLRDICDEQMLSDEFVKSLLPKIFTINLNESELRTFGIMSSNPNYMRTDEGYVLKPSAERLENNWLEDWRKFVTVVNGNMANAGNEYDLMGQNNANHTLLYSPNAPPPVIKTSAAMKQQHFKFLSAVLSNDLEMALGIILTPLEIRKRLTIAKRTFENNGALDKHLIDVQGNLQRLQLTSKMHQLSVKLRDNLIDIRRQIQKNQNKKN